MADDLRKVAIVEGAPGVAIQRLFRTLVARWQPSVRLAGVVAEEHGLADRFCSAAYLRGLAGGERFSIFDDRGPGSVACHLDAAGIVTAAAAVERDIAAGCDLVVLSKFGKAEAAGGGLRDAFRAAIEAELPILTSVAPPFRAAWEAFAAPLYETLQADAAAIEAWWRAVRPPRLSAAAPAYPDSPSRSSAG